MALPNLDGFNGWLHPQNTDAVVAHLRAYAQDVEHVSLAQLAEAPFETLGRHPELIIEQTDEPPGGCAVFGHYRPGPPPTIHVVRASTYGRDQFTLLHEYAHHLQQNDPEWADIEWRIKPESLRWRITEAIANAFASTTLIPEALLDTVSPIPTAREMAELHQTVHASRQAAIVRITRAAEAAAHRTGNTEHFFVTLADLYGNVVFSQMVGDNLLQPPRGSHQPDIERLIDIAIETDGHAIGVTSDGITYSSGKARSDVRLDVHLAHDGDYAFVVGTREHRYGTARWDERVHLCPSTACSNEFVVDETITICGTCNTPRCPECRSCECDDAPAATCTRCFTTLSDAERRAGRTDHDECPW